MASTASPVTWHWQNWWRQYLKTGEFPNEMGFALIVLFMSICRAYPASKWSEEGEWFHDTGTLSVAGRRIARPSDSAQDVILVAVHRLKNSRHNWAERTDMDIHRWIRAVMMDVLEERAHRWWQMKQRMREEPIPDRTEVPDARKYQAYPEEEDWIRYIVLGLPEQQLFALYFHACKELGFVAAASELSKIYGKVSKSTAKNWYDAAVRKFRNAKLEQAIFRNLLCPVVQSEVDRLHEEDVLRAARPEADFDAEMPPGFLERLKRA